MSSISKTSKNSLLASFALVASFASATSYAACTEISSLPYTISSSGSYCLTKNLTATVNQSIWIKASGVDLNLNGYTLSGPYANGGNGVGSITYMSGIGIYDSGVSLNNITVSNGTIAGMGHGIVTHNLRDLTIKDVNLPYTRYSGIRATDVSGLTVENSKFSTTVLHAPGDLIPNYGLVYMSGGNLTIRGNTIHMHTGNYPTHGMYLDSGHAVIQNNIITGPPFVSQPSTAIHFHRLTFAIIDNNKIATRGHIIRGVSANDSLVCSNNTASRDIFTTYASVYPCINGGGNYPNK